MKISLATLFSLSGLSYASAATMRQDVKGVEVVELEPNQTFDPKASEIKAKMSPDSEVDIFYRCSVASGKHLTLSSSKKFVGCCLADQVLVGSPETEFRCCGADHILAGNKDVGFSCCPTGQDFNGQMCVSPEPAHCQNGKELIDGKCQCPPGSTEKKDGTCSFGDCSSGISYGKCYEFVFPNGQMLSSDASGMYFAIAPDISHMRGVFKFCNGESCDGKGAIQPGDAFQMKDLRGYPATGHDPGRWVGNDRNGNHIVKRPDFSLAGNFTISKWTCGTYCLGGVKWGLGFACPSPTPAMTFWELDPLACVDITVQEVPCDPRDVHNNCIWNNGGCCDKLGCGAHYPPLLSSQQQQPL